MKNRLANVHNGYQDFNKYKRVLCVCSAGMLRSPTMAYVLSQEPYNYNTRAVGITAEYALIPLDSVLVEWAQEIVFADKEHANAFMQLYEIEEYENIKILNIPDEYNYRDPALVDLIKQRYDEETRDVYNSI